MCTSAVSGAAVCYMRTTSVFVSLRVILPGLSTKGSVEENIPACLGISGSSRQNQHKESLWSY